MTDERLIFEYQGAKFGHRALALSRDFEFVTGAFMIYEAYNLVSTGNMLGVPLGAFGTMFVVAGCGIQAMKHNVSKEYKTYKKEMSLRGLK